MKLRSVDLYDEDIAELNRRDSLKYTLTPEDARLSHNVHCVIKYDYIDLDKTDYSFSQHFEQNEIKAYFEKMKLISSSTIEQLSRKAKELHLYRSDIKGNLKRAVARIYPEMLESNPIIYHIALHGKGYTTRGDREKGTRCPRLYFIVGTNGHIYILFFDPYHELNPTL